MAEPSASVWLLACDCDSWARMPGAEMVLVLTPTEPGKRLSYAITAGLPVREHRGDLVLLDTPTGGTELVFNESFRPRIWGTGGYLRGRREQTLIDTAQTWADPGRPG